MQGIAADPGGFARARLGYVGLGLTLIAIAVVTVAVARTPPVPQPVAFNHRKHTQGLSLNCEFCHAYVTKGAHAGLPDAKTCTMCHQTQQGTSPGATRVTTLLAEGDPLTFNKLFGLESHVFYTHRRHVGIAKLECPSCHGDIAQTERPPDRPLVRIDMDFCMDCHRERGETLDCNACHR